MLARCDNILWIEFCQTPCEEMRCVGCGNEQACDLCVAMTVDEAAAYTVVNYAEGE